MNTLGVTVIVLNLTQKSLMIYLFSLFTVNIKTGKKILYAIKHATESR